MSSSEATLKTMLADCRAECDKLMDERRQLQEAVHQLQQEVRELRAAREPVVLPFPCPECGSVECAAPPKET